MTASGWRGRRGPVLLGVALVLALVAISVLTRDQAAFGDPLDPRNPSRDGAQAVARVLDRHGVGVTVVRGEDALLDHPVDAETTVVITNPAALGRTTADRLRAHARSAGALVVVGDAGPVSLWFGGEAGSRLSGTHRAHCDVGLVRGLAVRTYGAGLRHEGCFGADGSAALVRRRDLWLLTSPGSLTNQHVLEADNAALALRLLGQHRRTVWYVADVADTPASDGVRLSALLPPSLVPSLFLLLAAVAVLLVWRGRRLGPVVTEPLPVVVRAAESTRSRGQIYRRTHDRHHAATALVRATRTRLAATLRLPRDTPPDELAAAVAARTGGDPAAVHHLLADPDITHDSQLVALGQQLTRIENEVGTP